MTPLVNNSNDLFPDDEYSPRIVVWQLADLFSNVQFSKHECILTIDSISRTGRPIVVLRGPGILHYPGLFEIIEYGFALGLKMIVEAPPQDITLDVIKKFGAFGKKIFRIIVDDCITESPETRFQEKNELKILRECIQRLRRYGFEVHFSITVHDPDIRKLAFYHDYAFRTRADGLYCHLKFDKLPKQKKQEITNSEITTFIESIATMKGFSPKQMYFSPQCVKYMYTHSANHNNGCSHDAEWTHSCLAGKTFAYITFEGKVEICEGVHIECGDLRQADYNFKEIWQSSNHLRFLRKEECPCHEVRTRINNIQMITTDKNEP